VIVVNHISGITIVDFNKTLEGSSNRKTVIMDGKAPPFPVRGKTCEQPKLTLRLVSAKSALNSRLRNYEE
jgi:hypothetical protein